MSDSDLKIYDELLVLHRALVNLSPKNDKELGLARAESSWRKAKASNSQEEEALLWATLRLVDLESRPAEQSDSDCIEYICIDEQRFLILPLDDKDIRGVKHGLNIITTGGHWATVSYSVPTHGAYAIANLSTRNPKIDLGESAIIGLDKDGSMAGFVFPNKKREFSSAQTHGALSAFSGNGVIRGWVSISSSHNAPFAVSISIDGRPVAVVMATERVNENENRRLFSFSLPAEYLDGQLHKLDVVHALSDRQLSGCPIRFMKSGEFIVTFSNEMSSDKYFSVDSLVINNRPLHEQSDVIEASRIRQVKKIINSPSWILTAPLRLISSRLMGKSLPTYSSAKVTFENAQFLYDALKSTQSWRVSKPLRWATSLIAPQNFDKGFDPIGVFGPRLRYQILGPDGPTDVKFAKRSELTERSFSRGHDKIEAKPARDLSDYQLKLFSPNGSELVCVCLNELVA